MNRTSQSFKSPARQRNPLALLSVLLLLGCHTSTDTSGVDSDAMSVDTSAINIDNYSTLLREVTTLVSLTAIEKMVNALDKNLGSLTADLEDLQLHPDLAYQERVDNPDASELPGRATAANVLYRFSCVRGGVLEFYVVENVRIHAYKLERCSLRENQYTGTFSADFVGREGVTLDFDALDASTGTDAALTLTGRRLSAVANANSATTFKLTDARVDSISNDSMNTRITELSYTLAHLANDFSSGSERVELRDGTIRFIKRFSLTNDLNADLAVSAAWSGDGTLAVNIAMDNDDSYFRWDDGTSGVDADTQPWENEMRYFPFNRSAPGHWFTPEPPPEKFQWDTGSMSITAPGGSSMTLTPDPADSNTFTLQLSDLDEPLRLQWADGYQIACSPPLPNCI